MGFLPLFERLVKSLSSLKTFSSFRPSTSGILSAVGETLVAVSPESHRLRVADKNKSGDDSYQKRKNKK